MRCDTVHEYLGPFVNLNTEAWILGDGSSVSHLMFCTVSLPCKEIYLSGVVRGCRHCTDQVSALLAIRITDDILFLLLLEKSNMILHSQRNPNRSNSLSQRDRTEFPLV